MKIAMVAPFGLKTKGTVSARMLPMATALTECGHKVRLIVPPWDDPPNSPALAAKTSSLETRGAVEILTLPLQPKPLVAALPTRMIAAALNYKPDVIHVFKPKAYSGLAALGLNLLHHPFVLDTDDWEGPGGYNDVNPYSLPQKKLFAWQEQDLPQRAALVTVASRTLQSLIWSMGVAREKVIYLPNGISPEKYANWNSAEIKAQAFAKRRQLNLQDKLLLLAYTRFAEFKPARLLQIFQKILAKLSTEETARLHLLVVGQGFYGEEKIFQQQVEAINLSQYFTFVGQVDWAELPILLRCADIALYPFDDTLINRARCSAKLLELLVAERAVVTEAVGENREYIHNGGGGLLVTPGDTEAFAQAVVELIRASENERVSMGQQGAQRLWANYQWSAMAELLQRFIAKI